MNNKFNRLKKEVTLSAVVGHEKYLFDTIKAMEFSNKDIHFSNVQILSSTPFSHEQIQYIPIQNLNYIEYNKFMVKEYSKYINTQFVLHIQDDGFIINPDAWIDEFLEYDYIGALWPIGLHNPTVTIKDRCGNGGFTLRSKKFLDVSSEHCPYNRHTNEDAIVSRIYRDLFLSYGIKYAPDHIAIKFSIEDDTIPEAEQQTHKDRFSLKSFGFHQKNSDAIKFLTE